MHPVFLKKETRRQSRAQTAATDRRPAVLSAHGRGAPGALTSLVGCAGRSGTGAARRRTSRRQGAGLRAGGAPTCSQRPTARKRPWQSAWASARSIKNVAASRWVAEGAGGAGRSGQLNNPAGGLGRKISNRGGVSAQPVKSAAQNRSQGPVLLLRGIRHLPSHKLRLSTADDRLGFGLGQGAERPVLIRK